MEEDRSGIPELTVGLDLSDRQSTLCVVDEDGRVVERAQIATSERTFRRRFGEMSRVRVVLEVGPHSPWTSRLLEELGHEVITANPRKLRLIYENRVKTDQVDAEYLARVGRMDPELLAPVRHRGARTQADLAVIRSRDLLVRQRGALASHVRGSVKAMGRRLPGCSTEAFANRVSEHIPEELDGGLEPVLETIRDLSERIRCYDRRIEELCEERYPETERLRQIQGVGALTALCYVLTIEDPTRFERSRDVGAYLGLVPGRDQSGERDPRKGITKTGDKLLRRLLVSAGHYVLGPFGPDCDLRRWGLKLMERGGTAAKKRAAVAVARKLAVLLHHLWVSGEEYIALHGERSSEEEQADAA